jgi:hypothetical protein
MIPTQAVGNGAIIRLKIATQEEACAAPSWTKVLLRGGPAARDDQIIRNQL